MDDLKLMFNLQKEFQKQSGNGELPKLDGDLVSMFSLGLISELGEVLQEYKGWKPWKAKDSFTNNREQCLDEVVDMWHFMINLTLALGFDNRDLTKAFYETNEHNFKNLQNEVNDKGAK